jgi:hypothetical protein
MFGHLPATLLDVERFYRRQLAKTIGCRTSSEKSREETSTAFSEQTLWLFFCLLAAGSANTRMRRLGAVFNDPAK